MDISEIENTIEEEPVEEKSPRRKGSALAFLSFVFALVALAGTAWLWWQDEMARGQGDDRLIAEIERLESSDSELSLKLNRLHDEIESLDTGDSGAEIAALRRRQEGDSARMDSLEQAIREQVTLSRSLQSAAESMQGRLLAAEAVLTGLSSRELDAVGELDLAEVDYLLRLANERLKLFSDPVSADQALQVADMHLAALDNPMYLNVRSQIATARRDLAKVEVPDYVNISSELDTLQESIASLRFRGGEAVETGSGSRGEATWWAKVKSVFSSLVTIRRSTGAENERISLEDKDYIRQRMWLQLEIAHLTLMRRDQKAFRQSLLRVRQTLSDYFEPENDDFDSMDRRIGTLLALEVEATLPDISAPWSTLRLVRQGRAGPAIPAASGSGQPQAEEPSDREENRE